MLVLSGAGYHYFSQDLLIIDPQINYKVMFGCGIGIGLIFFIGVWIFLTVPRFICNYIVTFPAFIIIISIYIAFLVPSAFSKYMSLWDEKWEDNIESQILQIRYKCCGWKNYTDRALEKCQFNAESGCKSIINGYLKPRYNTLLILASLTLGLASVSLIWLILTCSVGGEDDLLAHFDNSN